MIKVEIKKASFFSRYLTELKGLIKHELDYNL